MNRNYELIQQTDHGTHGIFFVLPLYQTENLELGSIYPNPFNPNVTIEFSLKQNEHVPFSSITAGDV